MGCLVSVTSNLPSTIINCISNRPIVFSIFVRVINSTNHYISNVVLTPNPEGFESDLRAKIGQHGISSGVGVGVDLKFFLYQKVVTYS